MPKAKANAGRDATTRGTDFDETDAAKRGEAEKQKKAEEAARKKALPIQKNNVFLQGCPKLLAEMEVLLSDLSSRKTKKTRRRRCWLIFMPQSMPLKGGRMNTTHGLMLC